MCPKHLFFILIGIISFGCSNTARTVKQYDIPKDISLNSINFQKFHFRIEANGQLRSYKASYTTFSDSIIFIAIKTSLNKDIASFIFDKKGLKIFDISSKGGIEIDSITLNRGLGFCPSPGLLVNLVEGTPPDIALFNNNAINYSCDYTRKDKNIETQNSILAGITISNSEEQDIISTKYFWNPKIIKNFPKIVSLEVEFNEKIYEFDFEFDHRSYTPELSIIPEYVVEFSLTKFAL